MKLYDAIWVKPDMALENHIPYQTGYTIAIHVTDIWDCGARSKPLCVIDFYDDSEECREDWIKYTKREGWKFFKKAKLYQYDYYCIFENWAEFPIFEEIIKRYKYYLDLLKNPITKLNIDYVQGYFFTIEVSNCCTVSHVYENTLFKEQRINGACGGFGDTDFGGAGRRGFLYSDMETEKEFKEFFYKNARAIANFMTTNENYNGSPINFLVKERLREWLKKMYGREIKILRLAYPGLPLREENVKFINKFTFTDIEQLKEIDHTGYVAKFL